MPIAPSQGLVVEVEGSYCKFLVIWDIVEDKELLALEHPPLRVLVVIARKVEHKSMLGKVILIGVQG